MGKNKNASKAIQPVATVPANGVSKPHSSPNTPATIPATMPSPSASVNSTHNTTTTSPQPVHSRNAVNKTKAAAAAAASLSNPGTPTTHSVHSSFGRTSSFTTGAGSPGQQRRGGNRPGEFIMPACNPNKKKSPQTPQSTASNSSASAASSRHATQPASMGVVVGSTLLKVVAFPMTLAVGAAECYRYLQADVVLNATVTSMLKQKMGQKRLDEMAAMVASMTTGSSSSDVATPFTSLPAINDDFYTHIFLPILGGILLVVATVQIFSSIASMKAAMMKKMTSPGNIQRTNSRGGFESDENGKNSANAAFMPKIKKAKDPNIVALRNTEYSRLDRDNHCYLDYTGGMLYPESLVRRHAEQLINGTYGNPHSSNPTSHASTELCEKARADVLKFFNADPEEYLCIFTSNASGALRIVGESFPFVENSQYLLLMDNHNSVNGIREFAISRGAKVTYARTNTSLRIDDDVLERLLEKQTCDDETAPKLFAYPAQSNFSGVKHSLEWIDRAQQLGWYTLLDAAAFVPTSPLDLSAVKPDFVSMSFYKVFGYPTGIGALLMRKRCVGIMQRPWFAGGTIKFVTCTGDGNTTAGGDSASDNASGKKNKIDPNALLSPTTRVIETTSTGYPRDPMHVLAHDHEAFEDGTINYLSLSAISYGLEYMTKLDMVKVSGHVQALTSDLIDYLSGLVHSNGREMIHILGPNSSYKRGGTVSINVMDVNGVIIPPIVVEKLANDQMISIRSGCFCNPGDSEILFPEAWRAMMEILEEGDPLKAREVGLGIAAAIRISVGIPTSDKDISRVIKFLSSFKNKQKEDFDHIMVCPMAAH